MPKLPQLSITVDHTTLKKSDLNPLAGVLEEIAGDEIPDFDTYEPDLAAIKTTVETHTKDVDDVVVISNGGSRNNPKAFHNILWAQRNDRRFHFLSTQDPDRIAQLTKTLDPKRTLIMPISKSGTNVDMLEPLAAFLPNWHILPITSPETGVLYAMAKEYGWDIIPHPDVSGRFSGRTETGLAPAQAMGLNIDKINHGAREMYEACRPSVMPEHNPALTLATHLAILEERGYTEVFVSIYSSKLVGLLPLLVQLMHETIGKDGKGQTYFGDEAPESQHHTNQRFFDGRRNVAGLFFTVEAFDAKTAKTTIPESLRDLPLRDGVLGDLEGIALGDAIHFDFEGVHKTAIDKGIPHAVISVHEITEESVGATLGLLQYLTYYSARLRGQNPFDQPGVEASKELSWQLRRESSR